jgi:hypothetical protein
MGQPENSEEQRKCALCKRNEVVRKDFILCKECIERQEYEVSIGLNSGEMNNETIRIEDE